MLKWAWSHSLPVGLENRIQLCDDGQLTISSSADSSAPAPLATLKGRSNVLSIPIDYDDYPGTEAICLTGYTELGWIGQLVKSKVRYPLHIDGKHKLHHGKWILVTIGCHDLAQDRDGKIVHSYRPLVYMFSKQQETTESIKLLCSSVDFLARTYFGAPLTPGVINMDYSSGFMQGTQEVWPDAGTHSCIIINTYYGITHVSYQCAVCLQVSAHAGRI